MTIRTLEQNKLRAVARELGQHASKISLLSSSAFWLAHERGLEQVRAGQTVELADLRAKYGNRRS